MSGELGKRENPYSALAIYGVSEPIVAVGRPARPTRWPWWLNPIVCAALLAIALYQRCIPLAWKRRCIYSPSCSRYASETLRRHGLLLGASRSLARLRRCNGTLFRGGADPP